MLNKKMLFLSVGTIIGSCLLFITIGFLVNATQKTEPAFTGEYDVNVMEDLLYVTTENSVDTLFLQTNNESALSLFTSDSEAFLYSPIFIDEHTAAFIHTTGYERGSDPYETSSEFAYSAISIVDFVTEEITTLVETRGVLLDLIYIPTTDQFIVTGDNVSQHIEPEAQETRKTALYNAADGELQLIYEGSYAVPSSMQAAKDGQLMMILPDDQGNWTVDTIYESIERIYIADPTVTPLNLELFSSDEKTAPITSFVQVKDGLIYQTIFNYEQSDGSFDYDLVPYSFETQEEGNRLRIGGHDIEALRSIPTKDILYYVKRTDAYRDGNTFSIHRHDLVSGDEKEIPLIAKETD
ncbi:hypothetical protein [Shouchella miscanthi]|uniref:hypothetical protein n=1 Tax=Shouchella miscanthi TaxID=2598861 RepID=UPI0011A12CA1|nr:hypothetical protein [Shouchella miscanthi]